ncbi:MAG: radical SAM protein, partial [Candidatus Acidiferrales bacterium]
AARRLYGLSTAIKGDPQKKAYMDQALTAAVDEDFDSLELFNQNDAARNAVDHERHVRALTATAR